MAIETANMEGWGQSEGPSLAEARRLRTADWAPLAIGLAALAAGGWGLIRWRYELGSWGVAAGAALTLMTASLIGCSAGMAARTMALGGSASLAWRMACKTAELWFKLAPALGVCAAPLAIESALARVNLEGEGKAMRALRAMKGALKTSFNFGRLSRLIKKTERDIERWEESVNEAVKEMGPLAAFHLSRGAAQLSLLEDSVNAWVLSPFDPGWLMRTPERDEASFLEVCRQLNRESPEACPVDPEALSAIVEKIILNRETGAGLSGGAEPPSRLSRTL